MATVLVNNDNSMIVTVPERIMQHSKNIHTITIFVPQMYEGYDMSEFAAYIEIVPPNQKYRSIHLDANEVSRKEGFLQFDFEVTSDLTLFSGNISMEMTFVKTDEDTYKTYIRHTTSCSLFVTPIEKWSELIIDDALTDLDQRIALIEQGINGKEIECAVLGIDNVEASCVGQILSADEFYDYDSKYKNEESKTIIPADVSKEISEKIRETAIKAFKAVKGSGLARVDFFVDKETNEIYLNEINTMPGFTNISMYPKLWENCGLPYSNLLDKLIEQEL